MKQKFEVGECVDVRVRRLYPMDPADSLTWVFGWVEEVDSERVQITVENFSWDLVREDIVEVLRFPGNARPQLRDPEFEGQVR